MHCSIHSRPWLLHLVENTLKVRIDSLKTGDSTQLFTASGTPLFVVGKCDLEMNISGLLVPHRLLF